MTLNPEVQNIINAMAKAEAEGQPQAHQMSPMAGMSNNSNHGEASVVMLTLQSQVHQPQLGQCHLQRLSRYAWPSMAHQLQEDGEQISQGLPQAATLAVLHDWAD